MKLNGTQSNQSSLVWAAILGIVGFLNLSSATAQPKLNCANPTSNIEYKECAHRAYLASDQKLNQVYKQIISGLTGEEKQQLINTQLVWIKFRDTNCDFEVYRNRGGTGYSGFLSNCLERMTNSRIKELQDWQR
jgi:uncharacterized protein YecT (DUF1311 family)